MSNKIRLNVNVPIHVMSRLDRYTEYFGKSKTDVIIDFILSLPEVPDTPPTAKPLKSSDTPSKQ